MFSSITPTEKPSVLQKGGWVGTDEACPEIQYTSALKALPNSFCIGERETFFGLDKSGWSSQS